MALTLICSSVGVIVYRVRNNASPIIAIFGGIVCVVRARRTNDRTITIRVNEVIITSKLGRSARPVKIITSFRGVDQSFALPWSAVALSTIVIKSPMLGTVPGGVFVAELMPVWHRGHLRHLRHTVGLCLCGQNNAGCGQQNKNR